MKITNSNKGKEKIELHCRIDNYYLTSTGNSNCEYSVWDGKKCVAKGTSSNPYWVRNDAGGYHTKEKFDKLYPQGWKVIFDF